MVDSVIPEIYEDVTAEWLDAALRGNGIIECQSVTGFTVEPLHPKYGRTSSLARIRPEYDTGGNGPELIFAKFVSRNQGNRDFTALFDVFRYEIDVYRYLSGRSALRMPRFYYGDYTDDSDIAVLMIEAVDGQVMIDQPQDVQGVGLSRASQRTGLTPLAAMHGQWWGRVDAAAAPWLRDWKSLGASGLMANQGQISPQLREAISPYVSAETLLMYDRCPGALDRIDAAFSAMPQTLCHGDFHTGNLIWDKLPEASDVVAVDWQVTNRGPAARDLGYFLGVSTDVPAPHRYYHDQIEFYFSQLPDVVRSTYSQDSLLNDLIPAILESIVRFQIFFSMFDFGRSDAAELAGKAFSRSCNMAMELGSGQWLASKG